MDIFSDSICRHKIFGSLAPMKVMEEVGDPLNFISLQSVGFNRFGDNFWLFV